MRNFKTAWAAAGMSLAVVTAGFAQGSYPDRVVRIVVPFSAGSMADGFARVLADKLADKWKQSVIVENRPGVPGTGSVANSPADGYTLMVTSNGHVIANLLSKDLSYDPVKSFVGVTKLASVAQGMVVPPDLPAKTLADFLALAKSKPGELNFASNGVGSAPYMCSQVMVSAAKVNMVAVPYKGAPESMTAVMRGEVQMSLSPLPLAQQMAVAGKVKLIAINFPTRNAQAPDLPTIIETLPKFDCDVWLGLLAPVGTPTAIVAKVNQDVAEVLATPAVIDKIKIYGAVPKPSSPEDLGKLMASDAAQYAQVLKSAGITPK